MKAGLNKGLDWRGQLRGVGLEGADEEDERVNLLLGQLVLERFHFRIVFGAVLNRLLDEAVAVPSLPFRRGELGDLFLLPGLRLGSTIFAVTHLALGGPDVPRLICERGGRPA